MLPQVIILERAGHTDTDDANVALREGKPVGVVYVAHDPLEARALCQQAAVLEDGAIQETGALDTLLANPASMTLRTFVDQLRDTRKGLGAGAKPEASAESP